MTTAVQAREGHVEVTGGRIWYRIVGDTDATALVTVHGGPGATHDYLEPLQALADERPVVFYDQLGAGNSDVPDDPGLWTNDRLVDELGRLLDALGLARVHLLGQSWGTLIAAEYALAKPERLASVVLSNPCLSMPRYAAGCAVLRAALPAQVCAVFDRHEAAGTSDAEEYQAAYMEYFFRRHVCRLENPPAAQYTFTHINQAIYQRMQGPNEIRITGIHKDYDLTDRLGQLSVAALFACGRHRSTRPEDTAWYHSLVAGAELVVFEHSSHLPHLEEPEPYLQALRDFLRRAERAQVVQPRRRHRPKASTL
jgi:proline iminopeptidase